MQKEGEKLRDDCVIICPYPKHLANSSAGATQIIMVSSNRLNVYGT